MTICSKCGTKPARAEGQRYCDGCHAAYQRDYRVLAARKRDRAACFRGFEECRAAAIAKFEGALFQGWEAAQTMRNLRLP